MPVHPQGPHGLSSDHHDNLMLLWSGQEAAAEALPSSSTSSDGQAQRQASAPAPSPSQEGITASQGVRLVGLGLAFAGLAAGVYFGGRRLLASSLGDKGKQVGRVCSRTCMTIICGPTRVTPQTLWQHDAEYVRVFGLISLSPPPPPAGLGFSKDAYPGVLVLHARRRHDAGSTQSELMGAAMMNCHSESWPEDIDQGT